MEVIKKYDVVVVGGGSGGIGAAISSGRAGLRVLLIEKNDELGGTAVVAGVNCWEPGAGGTGIPFDIYRRMKKIPNGVGIYRSNRHFSWHLQGEPGFYPGGENTLDSSLKYIDSLRRYVDPGFYSFSEEQKITFRRNICHGVIFRPEIYIDVVKEMMAELSIEIRLKTTFTTVDLEDQKIKSLMLSDGSQVQASVFIDSTGNIYLAQASGCEVMIGQESTNQFSEPGAPEEAMNLLNGATLLYAITPIVNPTIEPLLEDIPERCWWQDQFPKAVFNQYPNNDININMLPTISGEEVKNGDPDNVYSECKKRVLAHWHHIQVTTPEYQYYKMKRIFPMLGVREGPRLKGKYVLTEIDLLAGISKQVHDDVIALADHAMDTHGAETNRSGCSELFSPYGIPYRCLLPANVSNLLIACRGASFSSLAASSCRLSRTMIQLGQAAGTAASISISSGVTLEDVPPTVLREELQKQHVHLDWPLQNDLREYLLKRDL